MYGHGTTWTKGGLQKVFRLKSALLDLRSRPGPFYPAWSMGERSHFSHTDIHQHALGRRAVAAAYSLNHLLALEEVADSYTTKLFGYFERAASSKLSVNVSELIERYAYDTVSEMSFGKPFGESCSLNDTYPTLMDVLQQSCK